MKLDLHFLPELNNSSHRVRLDTLLSVRWVAIIGQTACLLVLAILLDLTMPVALVASVIFLSVLFNLYMYAKSRETEWLSEQEAFTQLAFDIGQMSILLYLNGGISNPFAILMLAPVTMAATILSLRSIITLGGGVIVIIGLLFFYHRPLPWNGEIVVMPQLYFFGWAIALVISTIFFATYAWLVSTEARQMESALSETQIALLNERKVSALGALAAATAHELGTPLSTIAVVARELSRDFDSNSEHSEDIRLLISEVERCREIIYRLAASPELETDALLEKSPISQIVHRLAAQTPQVTPPQFKVIITNHDRENEPLLPISPEILQGLGNFIENALQFAMSEVIARITWNKTELILSVEDDGEGFSSSILSKLGQPYSSVRRAVNGFSGGHMGLGVFIATTLLRRSNATISFANRSLSEPESSPSGNANPSTQPKLSGAIVTIRWPILE